MTLCSRLLLLAALMTSLTVQAQEVRVVTRVVTDTIPAWKTWKENGFTMNHPGKWTVDRAALDDTLVAFRNVVPGKESSTPVVAVIVQGVEGKATPLQKRLKKKKADEVEFIPSDEPDADASRSECRYTLMGIRFHLLERVVEKGDRSYILTYVAPEEAYEESLFLAEAMLNSFSAPADR